MASSALLLPALLLAQALWGGQELRAAGTVTVDRLDDAAAASACTAAVNDCSLRGAVIFANANTGTTIQVPAGLYLLGLDGAAEAGKCTDATKGDLDVTASNTAIAGAGAGVTLIRQTTLNDRVLCVNPGNAAGFVFAMSGVTITGGRETFGAGGGGMRSGSSGGTATLTDVVFANNQASGNGSPVGGGLGHAGGNLVCTDCVFGGANPPGANQADVTLANQAKGGGGGLYFAANPGAGKLTLTRATFRNNVSTDGSGGGLTTTGPGGVYDVLASSFEGNQAKGLNARGGGVYNQSGTLSITTSAFRANAVTNAGAVGGGGAIGAADGAAHNITVAFSRLVGNTANVPAGGLSLRGGAASTMAANNNWWGQNSGPVADTSAGPVTAGQWLQLRHVATPGAIAVGAAATLTADLFGRNLGGPIAPVSLSGLPAFPAPPGGVFSSPVLGTLSAAATQFTNGVATATFTATGPGAGSALATADAQPVAAAVTITGGVVGGKNLTISTGSIDLKWDGGTAQTGYILLKYNTATAFAELLPIAGAATSYSDAAAANGIIYCYVLAPLNGPTVLGLSDMECAMAGVKAGTVIPPGFSLKLGGTASATMTWGTPTGGVDSYLLQRIPLDGSAITNVPLAAGVTTTTQAVTPAGTCFVLVGFRGGAFGSSDVLCGIPGVITLSASGSANILTSIDDAVAELQERLHSTGFPETWPSP